MAYESVSIRCFGDVFASIEKLKGLFKKLNEVIQIEDSPMQFINRLNHVLDFGLVDSGVVFSYGRLEGIGHLHSGNFLVLC